MKIPVTRRISKEDLRGGELPGWIDGLLTPLNQFITTIATALQNRLTFEENFQAKVLEFSFQHDTELAINPQAGRLRVTGILPSYAGGAIVTGFGWTQKSNGNVGITFQFSDSGTHKCKIVILIGA